jgi:hypothetical protein
MDPHGYIGIDFGTTNSHFAHALIEDGRPRAESISLGSRPANATCVLWRDPAETAGDIWLYGDEMRCRNGCSARPRSIAPIASAPRSSRTF